MDDAGIFTYDSSLPTARDRLRNQLGDTDPTKPLRYDETYDAMLTYWGDEATATAKMARSFASQFGRNPSSVSVPGGPSVSYSDRVKTWLDIATAIEKVIPAGGVNGGGYAQAVATRPGMNDGTQPSEYCRQSDYYPEQWR